MPPILAARAQADQPQPAMVADRLWIEPATVVCNLKPDDTTTPVRVDDREMHCDSGRGAVLQRIVQRFLRDVIQLGFHRCRQIKLALNQQPRLQTGPTLDRVEPLL